MATCEVSSSLFYAHPAFQYMFNNVSNLERTASEGQYTVLKIRMQPCLPLFSPGTLGTLVLIFWYSS